MDTKQLTQIVGVVTEALPNTMFRVQINPDAPEEYQNRSLLCTLSGKMRMYHIRVMPGDTVHVEVTPYDLNRGRITFRQK